MLSFSSVTENLCFKYKSNFLNDRKFSKLFTWHIYPFRLFDNYSYSHESRRTRVILARDFDTNQS